MPKAYKATELSIGVSISLKASERDALRDIAARHGHRTISGYIRAIINQEGKSEAGSNEREAVDRTAA